MRKKNMVAPAMAALVLLTAGLSSCGTQASQVTQVAPVVASYTGQDVFHGMFFGVGPARDAFGMIWDAPYLKEIFAQAGADTQAKIDQGLAVVDKQIELQSPGFFKKFDSDMRSGNPHVVREAVRAASKELTNAVKALGYSVDSTTDRQLKQQAPVKVGYLVLAGAVLAIDVAIAVNYGVGINVAVGIAAWFWVLDNDSTGNPNINLGEGNSLDFDMFIADVTDNLSN